MPTDFVPLRPHFVRDDVLGSPNDLVPSLQKDEVVGTSLSEVENCDFVPWPRAGSGGR